MSQEKLVTKAVTQVRIKAVKATILVITEATEG